jgi:CRP-like cAMP-binding protein
MRAPTREVLARLPLFARLPEEALEAVARRTATRTLPRDATLFRHGEPCRGLYVVLEGAVRIYRSNADGKEQVLHVQGPGQAVAEVPLFDGGPCPASARAAEDTRLLFLPRGDFEWLYKHNPEIADAVIRELGRRLRKMVRLVEKISLKDVPARVAATLLEHAEHAGIPADGLEFDLGRTQEELAAELATTRESVARALSRRRRDRIIERGGGRVRIRDLRALEAVAFSNGSNG